MTDTPLAAQIEARARAMYVKALEDAGGAGAEFIRNGNGNLWADPAIAAIVAALGQGEVKSGDAEDQAWNWLESKFMNVERGDDPNDRDYCADEMVDAFIAGTEARPIVLPPAPDERDDEVRRLRSELTMVANGFELSMKIMKDGDADEAIRVGENNIRHIRAALSTDKEV